MQSLLRKTYRLEGETISLCDADGAVVRRESLTALRSAQALIHAAENRAEQIRVAACEEACSDAEKIRADAHQEVWKYSIALQKEYLQMQTAMFDVAQSSLNTVIGRLLERLCVDATPRERVESAVRMILRESSDIGQAVLKLSSSDEQNLTADVAEAVANIGWRIELKEHLAAGECELQAGAVEWKTSLVHAANALRESLL